MGPMWTNGIACASLACARLRMRALAYAREFVNFFVDPL